MGFYERQPFSVASWYAVCGPLIGSYGHFGMGILDSYREAYKRLVAYYRQSLYGHISNIAMGGIGDVLIGKLPICSMDDKKDHNVRA